MKDVLLNDDFDLAFAGGDFATGDSNAQHEQVLLLLQKGSIKVRPLVGVGIQDSINTGEIAELLREIRYQFQLDGMQVRAVSWDDNENLTYDANYTS